MAKLYRLCPKCQRMLPQAMPESAQCPYCGIYFFKWRQEPIVEEEADASASLSAWLPGLLEPKQDLDKSSFYGRCVALALLAWWSWKLLGYDYRIGEFNISFMHNILLPIHEAGHIFFIPFGEFMTILGGSLFQLALPFGIAVAFVSKQHDNFGAAVAMWWASISLVDLSPYIYDALHPQMILLGGHTGEDGPHDWIYLLGRLGQLHNSQYWGAFAHGLGAVMAVAALVWAGAVLMRQQRI